MNVEIDKHDLFRNVVPGYVFLIVILSFYAATNRLDSIKETSKAIIGIVAGFPLGFLMQAFYRIIFHFPKEQKQMEQEDAKLISEFSALPELQDIDNWFQKAYPENERKKMRSRAYSNVFDRLLRIDKEREKFGERIYFLISYIHGLGASAFAIGLAVVFIIFIKLPLWYPLQWYEFPCCWREYNFEGFTEIILVIVWILGMLILFCGRESVKKSFSAAKKAYYLQIRTIPDKKA